MFRDQHALILANEPAAGAGSLDVLDKASGELLTRVGRADPALIELAIARAVEARQPFAAWPGHRRREVLEHVVDRLLERGEGLARVLALEAGKPIELARGEVSRAVETFRLAAEECTRLGGEYQPLDGSHLGEGYTAITRRVPVGVVSLITPFNFPLNLVAHKLAPALAAGCPSVLKPASLTPVSALLLGEILLETDLPPGSLSVLPCARDAADSLSADPRLALLSFTGSPDVGWALKARAGRMRVVLELGGNAACIVDETADLERAAERITFGAFAQAGQSCISVQRVLAQREIADELRERLVARAAELRWGHPLEEGLLLGPLISEREALRVHGWVAEALDAGARLLVGGAREGPFHAATWLEDVPHDAPLSCREVFGPVASFEVVDSFEQALQLADASDYGLQAGVFTRDLERAFTAFERLEVGGVVVGDIPSARVDAMPYGGVKASGLGREGVAAALEHMTEPRLMLLRREGG